MPRLYRPLLLLAAIISILSTNASDILKSGSIAARRTLKNKDPTASPTTLAPTFAPTPSPTISPTRASKNKQIAKDKDIMVPAPVPVSSPVQNTVAWALASAPVATAPAPTPKPTARPTLRPTDSPTLSPNIEPTGGPARSPIKSPVSSPVQHTVAWAPVASAPFASAPFASAPFASASVASAPVASAPVPTPKPTARPTLRPTDGPTLNPTMEPTRGPTPAPTLGPTESPSLKPSRVPSSKPSARPTSTPSGEPSSSPSVQPSAVPSSSPTLSRHTVILNEFNVLLTSEKGPVNVGELETTMEKYFMEKFLFDNLLRVKLDVSEGDSVTDELGTFISTSVRFNGTATFTSFLPPLDQIRTEQGFALDAKEALQAELLLNPSLEDAVVLDVSYDRIESTRPFDELDAAARKDNKKFGSGMIAIMAAVGLVTLLSIMGGVIVIRLRTFEKRIAKSKNFNNNYDDDDDDGSLDTPTKKRSKKEEIGHGCASLVSGQASLGNDLRVYSLPDSLDDIVIRPMFSVDDDDDDDAYLTMDDELQDPYDSL